MSFFENWLLVGLVAALLFGLSAVTSKAALSQKFFGLDPRIAIMLFLAGSSIVFLAFFFSSPKKLDYGLPAIGAGLAVGMLWALAQVIVFIALSKKANISQLAPVYNINTLVAVVLGIFLLGEIPDFSQALKIFAGAVLITIGAILVSG